MEGGEDEVAGFGQGERDGDRVGIAHCVSTRRGFASRNMSPPSILVVALAQFGGG